MGDVKTSRVAKGVSLVRQNPSPLFHFQQKKPPFQEAPLLWKFFPISIYFDNSAAFGSFKFGIL
ncbi:MAG: hypothetical protein KGZ82_09710, partial [Bacteroidales bacterium]|nr:hypothetical protein [Bacteroidales bacterium]